MQIYKILLNTRAEGPGIRACIWVQGCRHECKGCFAKHLWNYDEGKTVSADDIIEQLKDVVEGIDGITLLGGEPMDQAEELCRVAEYVKGFDKSVITFTGYIYEELLEKNMPGVSELLNYTDVLVDGPFIEELLSYDRPMVGSSNQRFIYLSEKIKPETMEEYKNVFELRVGSNGRVEVNGMGNIEQIFRENLF